MKYIVLVAAGSLLLFQSLAQTVGLIQHLPQSLDDGYVLFAPIGSNTTYLINKCGQEVHSWNSLYKPGQAVYLLPDGSLLHSGNANNTTFNAGGKGGVIEKIDWIGNVTWSYSVSDATRCQHHDVKALPNGNILVIAWESKSAAEAIAAGRNPATVPNSLWSEMVLELQPVGSSQANVVWEWHLWDHLVQDFDSSKNNYGSVSSNPSSVDINYNSSATNSDWIHLNSIDYNPELDQILLSSHAFCEIWIIDHSTSSAQAAAHSGGLSGQGGDLLYRWGNPQAYDSGSSADKKFFGQHNASWIPNGLPYANHILVFNNGLNRPGGNFSTVEILLPPTAGYQYTASLPYLPSATAKIYNEENAWGCYAQNISSAQQLSNGNMLVCNGPAGDFFEVDSTGVPVWNYINPVSNSGIISQFQTPSQNLVFRCSFYPSSFAGLNNQVFTEAFILEDSNPWADSCSLSTEVSERLISPDMMLFPNPTSQVITVRSSSDLFSITLWDLTGHPVFRQSHVHGQVNIPVADFPSGMYAISLTDANGCTRTQKIVINHQR